MVVGDDAGGNVAGPVHDRGDAERAPSQFEFFSFRKGVIPASGHEFMCGPLSVLYITKVLSAMPSSSSRLRSSPTCLSWSIITSWYSDCQRPDWRRLSGFACVRTCMWVVLNHTKNGVPAVCCRLMKSLVEARNSSSTVSMRFLVNGPVFSIFWPPLPSAQQCSTPRGPHRFRNSGKSFSGG